MLRDAQPVARRIRDDRIAVRERCCQGEGAGRRPFGGTAAENGSSREISGASVDPGIADERLKVDRKHRVDASDLRRAPAENLERWRYGYVEAMVLHQSQFQRGVRSTEPMRGETELVGEVIVGKADADLRSRRDAGIDADRRRVNLPQ